MRGPNTLRAWTARAFAVVAVGLLTFPLCTAVAPAAGQPRYPVPYGPVEYGKALVGNQSESPPGANDWSCKPSRRHPEPVVLVHGLGADQRTNWQTYAPLLANHGYCVFSLTYGKDPGAVPPFDQPGGFAAMEHSAAELKGFVDRVRGATGASKVDLLGHSEGTVMPRWYLKFLGGEDAVAKSVNLTPLYDGTDLLALGSLHQAASPLGVSPIVDGAIHPACKSCVQFLKGSDYLNAVNSGERFSPRIRYTNIVTRYDELVWPYTSGIGPDAPNMNNIVLQDRCPTDTSEHAGLAFDPVAAQHVLNALDPTRARPVRCDSEPPDA